MFHSAQNLLIQLLVVLTLSVPGIVDALMQSSSFEVVRERYETSLIERQTLLEDIERLEGKHDGIVNRITQLKQSGPGLTTRLALDELLRESKELSNELDGLQATLRRLDSQLSGQRTQLVGGIDRQTSELEQSLATASPKRRQAIVKELNTLRAQRQGFSSPLPAGPSTRDVSAALDLASQAEAPEELYAAADEIQDTEDQLRKRLAAINSRLGELKKSRRLMRRASSFSREEKFFEEVDRDRVIARYEKTSVTQDDPNKAGPDVTSSDDQQEFAGGNNATGNNDSFEGFAAAEEDAVNVAPPERLSDPGVNDAAADPPTYNGSDGDVFSEVRETVIINSTVDPSRSVGDGNTRRDGSLDTQIKSLESEKSRLKKQAESLRKRANQLRDQAKNL